MTVDPLEVEWRPRSERLLDQLSAAGHLSQKWRASFAAVARHRFVPRFWALDRYNSPSVLVDGAADPRQIEEWLDGVYTDRPLVTTWSQSTMGDRAVRLVTSSASQPSVVATMLDRLDVQPGHRVLEIGTGSGYNAALLCEYLDDCAAVVSVEIDPELARRAQKALDVAGYHPRIVVGDGSTTGKVTGPFDRIIATCAVDVVPDSWIEWLAPGGRLVAPSSAGNALLVLVKVGDGRLEGRIDAFSVAFMSLRSAPEVSNEDGSAFVIGAGEERIHLTSAVDPAVLRDRNFQLWLAIAEPRLRLALGDDHQNSASVVYTRNNSATVDHNRSERGWPVIQDEGRLWSAVEAAWTSFHAADCPERDTLRLTVVTGGATEFAADGLPASVRVASVSP